MFRTIIINTVSTDVFLSYYTGENISNMECLYCNQKIDKANNYCRNCGKFVNQTEDTTKPLPKNNIFNTNPLKTDSTDSSGESQEDIKVDNPGTDRTGILLSSFKFFFGLGLLTIIIHFIATYLAINSVKSTPVVKNESPIYFIQAIIAGLFVVLLFTPMGIPFKERIEWSSVAKNSFHQFLKGWSAVWITWFLLYLYIGIILLLATEYNWSIQNSSVQTTVDFLNACTSAAFLYMFVVLDMQSVSTSTEPEINKDFRAGFSVILAISFLIVLSAGFGRFSEIYEFGVYVSGFFAAISMAYVFGRLDSHHMRVNRWMLAPLYFYSTIQVVGPKLVDFGQNSQISNLIKDKYQGVFFATLIILKVYLFIVVYYWLQNGAFERYFNFASNYIEDVRSKKNRK